MTQEQKPQKKTASQRIDDLENAMGQFYQSFQTLARDVMVMRDAIKLLGNKVDAIVKIQAAGGALSDDTIAGQMVQNNIDDLKSRVDNLIGQGVLVQSETASVKSFIVGQEVDEAGVAVMPRTQFALAALPEPVQQKIIGSKAGDVILLEEGKLKLAVTEVYEIVEPKVETPETEAQA